MTAAALAEVLDEASLVRLSASPTTPPETLAALAIGGPVIVRVALALNPSIPGRTVERLARDDDERVRALLARKLAALAPGLSEPDQVRLQCQAYDALAALIADEAVRVRAAIADVIKDVPGAPRGLVLRLANDCAVSVSEPVIRFSPILTDEDLLALLESPPSSATALAVARRPDLTEPLADAIVAAEDAGAIQALLANPSAQIRESTLDALIAGASGHVEWHAPLVRRPVLAPHSARALADIVATQLLETLVKRADLGAATTAALRERLTARLSAEETHASQFHDLPTEQALQEAHRLARNNRLDEPALIEALRTGRPRLATAMLAVAAVVPISVVDRAASLRSAKGLVSLVWSAGFSMAGAVALQAAIGNLAPSAILTAGPGGGFPLVAEEMRWQLDFLRRTGR
ncbi:MAG TPA: DUF2336 domain-containing protein [Acetobacteraceae bacterium]